MERQRMSKIRWRFDSSSSPPSTFNSALADACSVVLLSNVQAYSRPLVRSVQPNQTG